MGAICEAILKDSAAAIEALVPGTHPSRKYKRITLFPQPDDVFETGALHRKFMIQISDDCSAKLDIASDRQTYVRKMLVLVLHEINAEDGPMGSLSARMSDDADQIIWALQKPSRVAAVVMADGSCLIRRIHAGTSTVEMEERPDVIEQRLEFELTYDSVMI